MDSVITGMLVLAFLALISTLVVLYFQSKRKGTSLEPWFSQQLILVVFMALQIVGRMFRSHETLSTMLAIVGVLLALFYLFRSFSILRQQRR